MEPTAGWGTAIRTARLELRQPVGTDVPAVLRLLSDPRTTVHDPGDASAEEWGEADDPARPDRLEPANPASARVAVRAGLVRAPELDADGDDGPDHLSTSARWTPM